MLYQIKLRTQQADANTDAIKKAQIFQVSWTLTTDLWGTDLNGIRVMWFPFPASKALRSTLFFTWRWRMSSGDWECNTSCLSYFLCSVFAMNPCDCAFVCLWVQKVSNIALCFWLKCVIWASVWAVRELTETAESSARQWELHVWPSGRVRSLRTISSTRVWMCCRTEGWCFLFIPLSQRNVRNPVMLKESRKAFNETHTVACLSSACWLQYFCPTSSHPIISVYRPTVSVAVSHRVVLCNLTYFRSSELTSLT